MTKAYRALADIPHLGLEAGQELKIKDTPRGKRILATFGEQLAPVEGGVAMTDRAMGAPETKGVEEDDESEE